ncbi:odorant receptor Or2-like isoform X2 [Bactrocera tryoni]|uniref:odorant receptor Or2-like isoform X2 n=1 Tax=Bactrocera tryoni TaxID=59916 RepID=UPI001A9630CF|nr:odorant receptor Or2-like isoform X2 [Bactrocera tryoni]
MSSYENLPLYAVNVKVFVKVGLIDSIGWMKRFLFYLILIISFVGQMINVFKTWGEDIGDTSMNFYCLLLVTHCLIRFSIVVKKAEKFERFFQYIKQWYTDIERKGDPKMVGILQEITRKTQKQSKVTIYVAAIAAIAAFFYPLSFDERKHIIEVQYLFFDVLQTPYYELFYLMEVVFLTPAILVLYLPFTNILLISLMFGELALKDLCVKLRNIGSENEETMLQDFKECIAYHGKIIDLCDDLEDLISVDGFFHVALFGMILCMLLFVLSMVHNLRLILMVFLFVSFNIYMIGITYFYANNLATESLEVANAAYDTPWYRGNLEMRKCVITMIARCQKPLQMTAGGLYPMTMETFQAILRVSYSYFSLLQGLNQ